MKHILLSLAATIGIFSAVIVGAQPISGDWNGDLADIEMANYLDSTTTLPAKTTNVFTLSYGTFTNNQPAGAISAQNTNLNFLPVHSYNSVGITFNLIGSATSTNELLVYASTNQTSTFGAAIFDSGPIAPGNGVAGGTNLVITFTNSQFAPITHVAFSVYSQGTTAGSNALLDLRLPKTNPRPWWERDN